MQLSVDEGSSFERSYPSEDPQIAIIINIVGLGTQEGFAMSGQAPKMTKQILIQWVLTEDVIEIKDEVLPMLVSGIYTYSMNEKANLYKLIKGWRGESWIKQQDTVNFDEFLGGIGLIQIENVPSKTDPKRKYTKVVGFNKVPKSMKLPKAIPGNEPKVLFDICAKKPDWSMFLVLKRWIQNKIMDSEEWLKLSNANKIPQEVLDFLSEESAKEEANKEAKKQKNTSSTKPENKVFEEKEEEEEAPWETDDSDEEPEEDDEEPFEMPSL